ncbi:MAG TPA: hypothetical protein VEL47_03145, partial [Myxococcota bacterium]|nr:hypothetical protein [Myxococcota bacterium]
MKQYLLLLASTVLINGYLLGVLPTTPAKADARAKCPATLNVKDFAVLNQSKGQRPIQTEKKRLTIIPHSYQLHWGNILEATQNGLKETELLPEKFMVERNGPCSYRVFPKSGGSFIL